VCVSEFAAFSSQRGRRRIQRNGVDRVFIRVVTGGPAQEISAAAQVADFRSL